LSLKKNTNQGVSYEKNCAVGGQAVIEGIMMRGSKCTATAVRLEDGSIVVNKEEYVPFTKRNKILNIPILSRLYYFN